MKGNRMARRMRLFALGAFFVTLFAAAVFADAGDSGVSEAVAVRTCWKDGAAAYRIPALVKSNAGTLIAVYDIRHNNVNDLPEDIDVGVSRSLDDGATWEPMITAIDFHGDDEKLEGVGDPSILVDKKTGRIWIAALWAHNGKSIAQSKPGLLDGESGRLVLSYSDDDGKTWSKPRDITPQFAKECDWQILFQGPGNGITLRDGTLVFPAQFWDKDHVCHSTVITSADSGETWQVGSGAKEQTSEAAVVELADGKLMLNMRSENRRKFRTVAVSSDLGRTWEEHERTSNRRLAEPVCQASLLRVASKIDGADADVLAFCNPNSLFDRRDMTLKLSFDDGETWTHEILLDPTPCWGYSSMTMLDAETIGVLYETNGGLSFRTVKWRNVPEKQPRPAEELYTTIERYLNEIASAEKIAALLPPADASLEEKLAALEAMQQFDNGELFKRILAARAFGADRNGSLAIQLWADLSFRRPLFVAQRDFIGSLDFDAFEPETRSRALTTAVEVLATDALNLLYSEISIPWWRANRVAPEDQAWWLRWFGRFMPSEYTDAALASDQATVALMQKLSAMLSARRDLVSDQTAKSDANVCFEFLKFEIQLLNKWKGSADELCPLADRLYSMMENDLDNARWYPGEIWSLFDGKSRPEIEQTGWLAVYEEFLARMEKSHKPEITAAAEQARGSLRFYNLPGNEMKLEGVFTNGKRFDPEEYRGKIIYVDFFTLGCGWCIAEFPKMAEIQAKYKDRGFEIIGYCAHQGESWIASIDQFAVKRNLPWPTISSPKSLKAGLTDIYDYYNISSVPTTVLIGRDGKVISTDDLRGGKLEQMLEERTK